jgi:hypothetical protein
LLRPLGVLWLGRARSLEDEFVELLAERPETDLLRSTSTGSGGST